MTSIWYLLGWRCKYIQTYPGCFFRNIWHNSLRSAQVFDIWLGNVNTFRLIKVVSDTIFNMIVTTYHDKPLICSGGTFWVRPVSPHRAMRNVVSSLFKQRSDRKVWTLSELQRRFLWNWRLISIISGAKVAFGALDIVWPDFWDCIWYLIDTRSW